jgi:hypothetical protein
VREFGAERNTVLNSITSAEYAKNASGHSISAEKKATIQELYDTALNRIILSIPGHTNKVDRFVAAKDKAGYRKHMEAMIRSKAPEAMAAAFRKVGIAAKPIKVVKTAARAVVGAKTVTPTTTGFTRVGTKPEKNAVNWSATGSARKTAQDGNKYILRDGSKVIWNR